MGFDSKGLDDYIDVAQRIAEFRVKHPEGSLQPLNPEHPFEIRELAGTGKDGKEVRGTFIIYIAAAYRSPDDQRPGVGCAYEVFPGRTPYTAGSELQNAETAAWGRAIVAALAADTRAGIASQQEVRNRQAERGQSAGDVFDQSAPVPPRQARQQKPAQAADDSDAEAQAFADEADKARTPADIEGIHKRAREAGKVAALIRNPASGGTGKLAVYLDWKRKQLTVAPPATLDPDDPWAVAFRDAADAVEAERLLADLRDQAGRGEIDPGRAALVEQAAEELFPGITAAEGQAAA
jgi:hypothetical protein